MKDTEKAWKSLSVVIPVYNEEDVIARCVDSILKNKSADMEIILVNDGSKDRTADVIRCIKDKRVRLFELEKNSGILYDSNIASICIDLFRNKRFKF